MVALLRFVLAVLASPFKLKSLLLAANAGREMISEMVVNE
jgi:hypothetical protein